jgi:hypothetical protein
MAPFRILFASALFAVLVSVAAARAGDDLGCPDPDVTIDVLGKQKLALLRAKGIMYDEAQFETIEGSGSAIMAGSATVAKVIIKAPIHTCRIKQTPGLREWVNEVSSRFSSTVEVQPFSQPPNINFFDSDGGLIERVKVFDDVTVADLTAFLRTRGVHGAGMEHEDDTLTFDDGAEDEDVRRAREAANEVRRTMAARAAQPANGPPAATAPHAPAASFSVDVSATGDIGVEL